MLLRIARALRRDDDGVAMAVVLGLLAVGLVLTSVVLTSVVGAQTVSTYTRAGVQSQAAAEAGIAAARAGIQAGTCSGSAPSYTSTESPIYVATIWRPAPGGGWVAGCPVGTATEVRILSTGYATSEGLSGADTGDQTTLEAILAAASTPTTITPSGPAIYAYSASSFGGSGSLVSVDGSVPDVLVKTGNVNCTGDATGVANFVVDQGTLTLGGSCEIEGNAFASGRMTFTGGTYVRGFVKANGITMDGSTRIYGRAWSTADISLSGNPTISGIAKAQSLTMNGGTLGSQAYVYGNTNIQNAGGSTLNGTVTTQSANPTPPSWWSGRTRITIVNPITAPTFASDLPPTPTVPDWVDFGAQADDFTSTRWTGFTVLPISGNCTATVLRNAITLLGSAPGVIDARGCTSGISLNGNDQFTLVNDVALIVNNIYIAGSTRFTAATSHTMWIINPDTDPDVAPTGDCPGRLELGGGATFPGVDLMLYSPCRIVISSGLQLRGQVFGGDVSVNGAARLSYVPIGLPGVDLSAGTRDSSSSTSAVRAVQSLRNVEP